MMIDPLYEDMFSFGSQINDILDKPSFTLDELLKEDDLLQEAKSMNHRLLDFLSQESTVSSLVDNIVQPASDTDSEFRKFKYPYMSCEVICLEIPEILNTLVNLNNGQYVVKLFTLLDHTSSSLDNYLAGYFEKILEMLFRKTEEIMKIINSQGIELFKKFLYHIDNYSIMQLVQRLMLPHIPTLIANDNNSSSINLSGKDNNITPDNPAIVCEWSLNEEYIKLICLRMLEVNNEEISAHISDLLITVVQLSPSDSLVISNLCTNDCLDGVLKSAFNISSSASSSSSSSSSSSTSTSSLSPLLTSSSSSSSSSSIAAAPALAAVSESISLASISVLESLISRLSEPPEMTEQTSPEELDKLLAISNACIDNVFINITAYFPLMFNQLKSLMDIHESSKNHHFSGNAIDDDDDDDDDGNGNHSNSADGSNNNNDNKKKNKKKESKISIMIDDNGEIIADPSDNDNDNDDDDDDDDIKQLSTAIQYKFQSKVYYPRLGNRGLQLVKLIESLVRLNLLEVDKRLCETGIFSILLDLFFYFSQNSLLHLSIQRLILTIIQGGDYRQFTQQHILIDSKLIERIMDYLTQDYKKDIPLLAGLKSPLLGHVIVMGESLFNIIQEHNDRMLNEFSFVTSTTTAATTIDSAANITATTAVAVVKNANESGSSDVNKPSYASEENENDDGWSSSNSNSNSDNSDHYSSNTSTAIASAFPLTHTSTTTTTTTTTDNSTTVAAVADDLHIIDIAVDMNELSINNNDDDDKLTEIQNDKRVSDETDIFGVGNTDSSKNKNSQAVSVDMNNDYGVGYDVSDNLEDDPNATVNIDVGGVGNNAFDKATFDKKHHHNGSQTGSGKNDSSKTVLSEKSQNAGVAISSVPQILSAHNLIDRWGIFSNEILNKYLEKQFVNQQLGNNNSMNHDSIMLSNHNGGFGNSGLTATDNNTSMSMYNGNNSNAFSSSDEFNDNFYKDDDDDDDDEIFGKHTHDDDDDNHITHFSSFHQLSHSNNNHMNPHGSGSSYIGEGLEDGDDSENASFSFSSSFDDPNSSSSSSSSFDPFGMTQTDLSAFADFTAFSTAIEAQQSVSAHRYGEDDDGDEEGEEEHHDETGSDDSGDVISNKHATSSSSGSSNRSSSKSSGHGSNKSNNEGSGKHIMNSNNHGSIIDPLAQLSSSSSSSSSFEFDPFGDSTTSVIDIISNSNNNNTSSPSSSYTNTNMFSNAADTTTASRNTPTTDEGIVDLSAIEAVFDFDPFGTSTTTIITATATGTAEEERGGGGGDGSGSDRNANNMNNNMTTNKSSSSSSFSSSSLMSGSNDTTTTTTTTTNGVDTFAYDFADFSSINNSDSSSNFAINHDAGTTTLSSSDTGVTNNDASSSSSADSSEAAESVADH